MAKRLQPGEKRTIRAASYAKHTKDTFAVTAYCFDEDTPIVSLTMYDGTDTTIVSLPDIDAEELARQLNKALEILPSSK